MHTITLTDDQLGTVLDALADRAENCAEVAAEHDAGDEMHGYLMDAATGYDKVREHIASQVPTCDIGRAYVWEE